MPYETNFQRLFLAQYEDLDLDCLIMPGVAVPAWPHGAFKNLFPACCYAFAINLLRWPCGTIPVTKVRADEQRYESDIRDCMTKLARKSMVNSAGLPIGIQIMTPPFEDERCMRCMREIEALLKQTTARKKMEGAVRG